MKYSVNIFVENVKNTPHLNQEQFSYNYPLIGKAYCTVTMFVCIAIYMVGVAFDYV